MSKKIRKNRTANYTQGMVPTKERQQKNGGVYAESIHAVSGGKTYTKRYRAQYACTLDHYLDFGKITETEYEAGSIFARAYLRFVMRVRVDDHSGSHGDTEIGFLSPLHSEKLLNAAYDVLSPAQKKLVISVCGHDYGVGDSNRLKTFKRGLGALANLWKLP